MLCGTAADHDDENGDEDGDKIVFGGGAGQAVLLLIKYVDAVWSVIGRSFLAVKVFSGVGFPAETFSHADVFLIFCARVFPSHLFAASLPASGRNLAGNVSWEK